MKRLFLFVFLLVATPALAQWQVPLNSLPLGRGPGVTGFTSVLPGTNGNCLVSNGTAWLSTNCTSTYVLPAPIGYANGGCNAITQVGCRNNIFPAPTRAGDLAYWNGSAWVTLAGNNSGTNCVQENSSGVPAWTPCATNRIKIAANAVINFYANSSATGCSGAPCSDSNDGLTTATAKKTILGALYAVLTGYDFSSDVGSNSVAQINLLANEVNAGQVLHFGPHDYPGAAAGGSVTIDLGGFTYEYDSGAAAAIEVFFGPAFQIQNGKVQNTIGPCVSLFEHGSIRFGANFNFGNCGIGLQTKSGSVATFLNSFTNSLNTTQTAFIQADENSFILLASGITITCTGAPVYTWTILAQAGSQINLNNPIWSGCGSVTGQRFLTTTGGSIYNGAASIPGTNSGTNQSGGTSDGNPMTPTAGGTGTAGIYVLGTLPTCNAAATSYRAFVADSNSVTYHATYTGGGANAVSVICNGTVWYVN